MARQALASRRLLRRPRGQFRGLFGECRPGRSVPVRRGGPAADPCHSAAGIYRRDLARLPARGAAGPALRPARPRPLRAAQGAPVQPAQAAARPLRQGDDGPHQVERLAVRLPRRLGPRRPVDGPPRQRGGHAEMRRDRRVLHLGRRPPPAPPLVGARRLRGAREGHDGAASRRAGAPARHLCRPVVAPGHRAPAEARRHGGRAPAGARLRRRPPAARGGAQQLLGLQHHLVLRAGAALPVERLACTSSRRWSAGCTPPASR